MPKFEWDSEKSKKNLSKHNVGFDEAKEVFDDEYGIEKLGKIRGERRIVRIGKTTTKLILTVVYTMRDIVIRLISARQASKSERNAYVANKFKKHNDDKDEG